MKLILFLVLIVTSYENCSYYHYFDENNNYKCTLNNYCPAEYNKLIPSKKECTNDCRRDNIYKYEYKMECFEECPKPNTELINNTYCSEICTEEKPYLNTLTLECVESCDDKDTCINKINQKLIDNIIKDIEKALSSFKIDELPDNIEESEIKPNIITSNQTKEKTSKDKYIDECELLLKQHYNIPKDDNIFYHKILDKYEAFYKFNQTLEKLDMSICEKIKLPEIFEYFNDTLSIECGIENPFENLITHKCVKQCDLHDLYNGFCILNYRLEESDEELTPEEYNEFQNSILNYFEDIVTSEQFYFSYLSSSNYDDNILTSGKMTITLTTPDNQIFNRDYDNGTTIDLGSCENKLKEYYHINQIYIKKIDILETGKQSPIIEYDIYGKLNNNTHLVKLNKSICGDLQVSLFIPIELKEELEYFNEKGGYFNDICDRVNSEVGKDLTLEERKKQFIQANKLICNGDCDFIGYDTENKQAKCSCKVKDSSSSFEELKSDKTKLYQSFKNPKNTFNLKVLSCNILNSKDNIKTNIGFYILTIIIIIFILIVFIFYSQGNDWLRVKMEEIIQIKYDKVTNNINEDEINRNNNIINNPVSLVKPPIKQKKLNIKRQNQKVSSPIDNNDSKNSILNKSNQGQKDVPMNIISVYEQNVNVNVNVNMNYQQQICPISVPDTDYELNWLSYTDALKYDKRTFGKYYCSLIKSKQILIFSFCPSNDYDSIIVKKYFFFLSFAFHYTINAFLFSDHSLYKEKFIIIYHLPIIIYSSLFSTFIVRILVRNLALTNRNVLVVKHQADKNTAIYIKEKQLRCIKIKFIVFFSLNSILLGFFWLYLTSFNAIYKDSQTYVLKDTIISFIFSLVFPFFNNIFPALFRSCSLNWVKNWSSCVYKLSQIIQLF